MTLPQRLLSSIAAFARTLEVHRRGLQRAGLATSEAGAEAFVQGGAETEDEPTEEAAGEKFIEEEEDRAAEAAAALAAGVSDVALVDEMLEIARTHRHRPDARMHRLVDWIRSNMAAGGRWNERRLVLFTEYEDTRRWVQRRLAEALDDLSAEDRIAAFTGSTPAERREELKRRFNSDPTEDPLRILVCTDAAREGINLQMRCHDLIHIDLPWNPARLEQRNGRIDRKLQPSPEVWCRYFAYEQREEDVVLEALVRKTERIRDELGSAGHVLARQLTDRLEHEGIFGGRALAQEIDEASNDDLVSTAVAEMDDATEARLARQAKELDDLRRALERSRERGLEEGLHKLPRHQFHVVAEGKELTAEMMGADAGLHAHRHGGMLARRAATWPRDSF